MYRAAYNTWVSVVLSSGYLVYQGGLQAGRQTAASAAATICTHQMQCKADRLKLRVLLERCWNDCCCCRSVSHRVATKASASGSIGAGGNGLPSSCNGRNGHCHCHLPTTILYFRFSLSLFLCFLFRLLNLANASSNWGVTAAARHYQSCCGSAAADAAVAVCGAQMVSSSSSLSFHR